MLTELDAVNRCLFAIGESHVNSLDGAAIDARDAHETLKLTSMDVQSVGWHWNREVHSISPDANGTIYVPANTIKIDTIDDDKPTDVSLRGNRLFKLPESSYVFDRPVRVELYVCLPWDDLPYPARRAITDRAVVTVQAGTLGSDLVSKEAHKAAQESWINLQHYETETADYNVLNTPENINKLRRHV